MKKADLILNAVGDTDSKYLSEVDQFLQRQKKKRYGAIAGIAAMLVLATVISFAVKLYHPWGGNAHYGIDGAVGGGYFYFEFPHDGIYRYTPGKASEKILDIKGRPWYDFVVNDDALFYTRWENSWDYDKTIYRVPHGLDTVEVLFYDDDAKSVNLPSRAAGDDLFVVLDYDNDTQGFGYRDVIIDGQTGEIKNEVSSFFIIEDHALSESMMYSDIDIDEQYQMTHKESSSDDPRISYTVGDRTIIAERNDGGTYDLLENGEKIYESWDPIPQKMLGSSLVFSGGVTDEPTADSPDSLPKFHYLIVRPDGTRDSISLENVGELQGNDTYIFYIDYDDDLIVYDTRTSESKVLMHREELSFFDVYSDGKYIYLSRYNDESSLKDLDHPMTCYQIQYDSDGKPQSLKLIDNDIND